MDQLLSTKFYIPPFRPGLVPRPRLIEKLNACLNCKLTLISAPAGFGKTTLVSEWVRTPGSAARPANVAWLSLDEEDNDLDRFLIYSIAALQTVNAGFAQGAMNALRSPQPPPTQSTLISLINELAATSGKVIFILDDYHRIDAQPIHNALSFLLERIPPQLHLVIVTREDPLLPLSRLRVQGHLTELRAADLRFTSLEAAEFLNQVMGLNLSKADIAALETRTEGWIAGLQLASLALQGPVSMQKIGDSTSFIRSFTGSHRLVLDYLIEEVLDRQPENIKNFLQQTSILDRLNGSLCNALTGQEDGQEDGQATLEHLEQANLFIVPLDNERRWYRYHHLFSDLLRKRLHQIQPEQLPILHSRASTWYENNGFTEQAIKHSLRAEDFDRATLLAELAWPEMHRNYRGVTWLRWVDAIPDERVRARPVLSTGYGWSLIDSGDLEGADIRLRDAEQWLEARTNTHDRPEVPNRQVDLNEKALRSLSASIANARAYLAQALGDVGATEQYAQQALDLLPEGEYFERGLSSILQGFAYWSSGDLDAAHRAISDAISNMKILGKIPFIISFTSYLADIMIAQGRLNETKKVFFQLLDIAEERGEPEYQETAVVHLGLSEIFHEQGDRQAARWHLLRSEELGELPAFPPWYRHWVFAQIRIKETDGDLDGVFKILNESGRLYYRHPIPDIRPLSALIARAQLVAGRLAEAINWVNEQALSVDHNLSYLGEFDHVTLARILIARYKQDLVRDSIQSALGLLEGLRKAAEEGGRMGSVIEILVLQALAFESQGQIPSALESLERALAFAEPEGYFQVFVAEGPPMAHLLSKALSQGISPAYVRRLLAAFPDERMERTAPPQVSTPDLEWIEPLSEREIEVLRLIAEGLTNPEIAVRLYLSLNTVKSHTRNIYAKLNVHSRTQAIVRAQELDLLHR